MPCLGGHCEIVVYAAAFWVNFPSLIFHIISFIQSFALPFPGRDHVDCGVVAMSATRCQQKGCMTEHWAHPTSREAEKNSSICD